MPALQVQPATTSFPVLSGGQETAAQELEKNGLVVDALTKPAKPALQLHPATTLIPVDAGGQSTAVQELL